MTDVRTYRETLARGGMDRLVAQAYVTGAGLALAGANVELRDRRQPPLFCAPNDFVHDWENLNPIIETWIARTSKVLSVERLEKYPVFLVLMQALIQAFPCPKIPADQKPAK
jgi:hypothetical protein